jgi:hypothetical protein
MSLSNGPFDVRGGGAGAVAVCGVAHHDRIGEPGLFV